MIRSSAALMLLFLLCGCSHVISESSLKLVDQSVSYRDLQTRPEAFVGKTVLVGGVIAGLESSGDISTLEVARLELLKNGVPDEQSRSTGRFLAVSSQLIDPMFFRPGHLITIVGEVKGRKVRKLNEADYPYPLIAIREMRQFRASEAFAPPWNPYQNQFGDEKFLGRPPGLTDGEPRREY